MIWLLAVAAPSLALGYAAGRLRPLRRLAGHAYDFATAGHEPHSTGWFAAEAVALAMVLAAVIARPRQTVRRIRELRRPRPLEPAPEFDPDWGRR